MAGLQSKLHGCPTNSRWGRRQTLPETTLRASGPPAAQDGQTQALQNTVAVCFYEHVALAGVSRADAIKALAAVGGLPLIGGLAPKAASALPVNDGSEYTALVGATALIGDSLSTVHDATIVLQGNRIVAAGPSGSVHVPAGAKHVVLHDKYVLPGLIDSHVHFFQSGGLFTRPDTIDLRSVRPYAEELAWIDAQMPDTFVRYLRAGITSVSDVGGPFWNYDVRARAARTALAPRVAAAGPLISSVDRSILSPSGDPPIVRIDDPEAARELVRREAERRTDFVKLWWIDDVFRAAATLRRGPSTRQSADGRDAVHARRYPRCGDVGAAPCARQGRPGSRAGCRYAQPSAPT